MEGGWKWLWVVCNAGLSYQLCWTFFYSIKMQISLNLSMNWPRHFASSEDHFPQIPWVSIRGAFTPNKIGRIVVFSIDNCLCLCPIMHLGSFLHLKYACIRLEQCVCSGTSRLPPRNTAGPTLNDNELKHCIPEMKASITLCASSFSVVILSFSTLVQGHFLSASAWR